MKIIKPDDAKIKALQEIFKILSEKHRLKILSFLKSNGQKSVGQIADYLQISFKATSKHLLFLTKKGILKRHHDGPFVLYRISTDLNPPVYSSILKLI